MNHANTYLNHTLYICSTLSRFSRPAPSRPFPFVHSQEAGADAIESGHSAGQGVPKRAQKKVGKNQPNLLELATPKTCIKLAYLKRVAFIPICFKRKNVFTFLA